MLFARVVIALCALPILLFGAFDALSGMDLFGAGLGAGFSGVLAVLCASAALTYAFRANSRLRTLTIAATFALICVRVVRMAAVLPIFSDWEAPAWIMFAATIAGPPIVILVLTLIVRDDSKDKSPLAKEETPLTRTDHDPQ